MLKGRLQNTITIWVLLIRKCMKKSLRRKQYPEYKFLTLPSSMLTLLSSWSIGWGGKSTFRGTVREFRFWWALREERVGLRLFSSDLTGATALAATMPALRMRNQGSEEKTADGILHPCQRVILSLFLILGRSAEFFWLEKLQSRHPDWSVVF